MAFHLYPNCLVDSMEKWISTNDEIHTITKDLHLNWAEYGLQTSLLQQKEVVFWPLTYSVSVTNEAWKQVSLHVMKFVYWHSTYLSVHNSEIHEFALDPQPICAVLNLETWLVLCLNTCIWALHLLSLIRIITLRSVRQEEKTSQET